MKKRVDFFFNLLLITYLHAEIYCWLANPTLKQLGGWFWPPFPVPMISTLDISLSKLHIEQTLPKHLPIWQSTEIVTTRQPKWETYGKVCQHVFPLVRLVTRDQQSGGAMVERSVSVRSATSTTPETEREHVRTCLDGLQNYLVEVTGE